MRLKLKSELFYGDNRMVAFTKPEWIQTVFYMLTGIFDWLGLQTNVRKTMGVVFQPFRAAGVRAEKAYTRQMTVEGRSYKEKQRDWVHCPECGKDLVRGSLVAHLQTHHGMAKGRTGQEGYK